jgi:hypothetical protein
VLGRICPTIFRQKERFAIIFISGVAGVCGNACKMPGGGLRESSRTAIPNPRGSPKSGPTLWISNYRRLCEDYEYWESTSQTMIQLAMTRVMLQRLAGFQLTPAAAAQLAA